jgi:hypothetical protein
MLVLSLSKVQAKVLHQAVALEQLVDLILNSVSLEITLGSE